jgi:GNAT superfamily N-acetyltransferase
VPGVAHFWLLFVAPARWGQGLGRALHDVAVAQMRVQGYHRAELWTPVGAAAARALYARSGWVQTASHYAPELGLELLTVRLEL